MDMELENQQLSHQLFKQDGGDGSPKCELQHTRVSKVKYSFSAGSSPFRTRSFVSMWLFCI